MVLRGWYVWKETPVWNGKEIHIYVIYTHIYVLKIYFWYWGLSPRLSN